MGAFRDELINQLREYRAINEEDARSAQRILEFVGSTPQAFERTNAAGHLTGSAWVTNRTGDKVLLLHHRKLGRWLQPGGHADGNEDLLGVAKRETVEECGVNSLEAVFLEPIDVDVHLIPARGSEPEHFHYDVRYALRVDGSEHLSGNEESLDVAWFDVVSVEDVTEEPSVLRMRDKWLMRLCISKRG